MDLTEACEKFKSIVSNINQANLEQFLRWAKDNIDDLLENAQSADNSTVMLDSIRDDIRQSLPLECTTPTERIVCPTSGPNADCDTATTVHVDAFLYDEDTIDELCDAGQMSRNYCTSCQSRAVKPLTFITHSASVPQIKYIYQDLLKDLHNKTVLDVGSRTGALLYGAYLYSDAARIIGVELDSTFCTLQQSIVQKYDMTSRIQIIHSDIMLQVELLHNSDVVILNNVFEFFMDTDKQTQIWRFLRNTLRKPGILLITIPSIDESLSNIKLDLGLGTWLRPVDVDELRQCAARRYFSSPDDSDLDDIHMYQVLG